MQQRMELASGWPGRRTLLFFLAILVVCCDVTEADDGYTIPADAIRIGADELAADRLTDHLAGLIGNDSSRSDQRDLELEELVEADDDDRLPTVLARLNALLEAAEERKERFESNAATSRLLSINRGGYFRGRKFPFPHTIPTHSQNVLVFVPVVHDTCWRRAARQKIIRHHHIKIAWLRFTEIEIKTQLVVKGIRSVFTVSTFTQRPAFFIIRLLLRHRHLFFFG